MADGNEEIIDNVTETVGTETNTEETVGTESFNFLDTVKLLLAITDDSKDAILQVYINLTKQSILNYCNLTELPSALNYTLCSMVCDVYKEAIVTSGQNANVSSITEDGRTVSFASASEIKASIDDRISKLKELNRYRKLYRV